MGVRYFLSTLICCSGFLFIRAQQTSKTLLWRISGNGFAHPSYLYGTMHSKDKRVYYLGDSVYSSIKFCDGFAMEIDPGEMIDTLISNMESKELNVAYRKAMENSLIKKGPDYYRGKMRELDSIYNQIRQRYNDLSARDIARLEKTYRRRDRNNMNTTFDLYLFDLAKRQGKVVGGIEDITDQTSLRDELGNTFNPDLFLKNQRKKYVDVEEWMIINYTAAELDKLHEFSKLGQTERQMSLILYNRNDKMSRRIDSLGKIRSTFCAVGAAHLPGDSGVINLLKKKGFVVEPVFSSKKIEPGNYKLGYGLQPLISISDPDSNYTVQMPGKPTALIAVTDKLVVRAYKELSNEILLMCGVYEDGNINKTIDREVGEIKKFFSAHDVKLYNTDKLNRQGLEGYDINFKSKLGYVRLHIFHKNGKTYLFAAGAGDRDSLKAGRCENYLTTYRMNLDKQASQTEMLAFSSPDKAFTVSMPGLPKKEIISGALTYTKEDVTLFSSTDLKKKIHYLVLVKEPFKGYFNDFDSTIFSQTISDITKDIDQKNMVEIITLLDDHPASKIKVRGEVDGKIHVLYSVSTLRHNRFYNLTARALAIPGNETLFDEFIRSFHFLPYLETEFENQAGGDRLFSVKAPSPVQVLQQKSPRAGGRTDYYAFDSCTSMTYGITSLALDSLYWTDSKNSLLNEYARIHFNDSLAVNKIAGADSLLYSKTVFNGNTEARELLLQSVSNHSYSRIRIMHYADSVFVINLKGGKDMVTNTNADLFFNSFRFTNENFVSHAFTSKTDLLIAGLQSAGAGKRNAAVESLKKGFRFPPGDLPKMMNALLYDYGDDAGGISPLLARAIAPFRGAEMYHFIKTNYPSLRGKRENIRVQLFNMLAESGDAAAYRLLKDIIINDPPAGTDYGIALAGLTRYAATAAELMPDVAAKLRDESLGPFTAALAAMLIDSNRLQYSTVKQYEEDIYRLAKKMLGDYRENNNEKYNLPFTGPVLEMLARANQKQSRSLLNDFIELQNYSLSLKVIKAVAKSNQAVSPGLMNWYANTPARRIEVYDELARIGKQAFFTGEYANQHSFADAFMRIFSDEEIAGNIPKYYDLVAIKNATVNNRTSRFYIYKVTCQFKRQTESFTGIIGPFSTNDALLSIEVGQELYILYRTPFDPKNTDRLLEDFIGKAKKMN